ncbi:MotE family protein [Bacillus massilinigeriensis]|uniref:MotE family protein n=1 Tax=Bacillus mediterraneensis TaxID=1805474 RepID=UPI0008F96EAA|nr:MotE family protein [Bacillus mediterraneensis]
MSKLAEEKEIEGRGRLRRILSFVILPALFAVTLALIVMSFAGINIFDSAREIGARIPGIKQLVQKSETPSIKEAEKRMIGLEAEIKNQEAKMEQLQSKLDNKEKENDRIQLEKQQLEEQIDELAAIQAENKRAFKDIVRTYETMSPKSAAPIIAKMEDGEALKILKNVKPDSLSAIMEKMVPEDAAKYTELLTSDSNTSEKD